MNLPKPPEFTWENIEPAIDSTGSIEPIRAIALVNAFIADAWAKLFEGAYEQYTARIVGQYDIWDEHIQADSTHRAIRLKPERIQMGVGKSEIVKMLSLPELHTQREFRELANRIQKEGIR